MKKSQLPRIPFGAEAVTPTRHVAAHPLKKNLLFFVLDRLTVF